MNTTQKIQVPTNVVTGFLGSGKTTLIQSLLQQKPENEYWAILINEFGEVGLDEALIEESQNTNDSKLDENNVQISQISGGCLCCANGVPFQIALVQLISKQEKAPDRLIIEPTGIGHPEQIINQLTAQPFIDLQTVITVIDPRKSQDAQYRDHEIFNSQVKVADLLVCNKNDSYQKEDYEKCMDWIDQCGFNPKQTLQTCEGQVDISYLTAFKRPFKEAIKPKMNLLLNQAPSTSGSIDFMDFPITAKKNKAIEIYEQSSDGFYGLGLIFDETHCFDEVSVMESLMEIESIRIKGAIKTQSNGLMVNCVDDVFTENKIEQEIEQSRFQFIGFEKLDSKVVIDILLSSRV